MESFPSSRHTHDAIIFGGGLAGIILAEQFIKTGKRVLLVDDPSLSQCSRVAAGIINPIGGKRLKLVWMADQLIPYAIDYYKKIGAQHKKQFFYPKPIARLFANESEMKLWQKRATEPTYQIWTTQLDSDSLPEKFRGNSGFKIPTSGYLDTKSLIESIVNFLQSTDSKLLSSNFRYDEIKSDNENVQFREYTSPIGIFCEGHLATGNPWFNFAPFKPAKGIIGLIRTSQMLRSDAPIVLKQKFLVPRQDGLTMVGATYNWSDSSDNVDEEGVKELEDFLNENFGDDWLWVAKRAGVRPATAGAYPIIGRHPVNSRLVAFNGFGSKGAMQIPYFANQLISHLINNNSLLREVVPERFHPRSEKKPKRWIATDIAKEKVLTRLKHGDLTIDATCGNGHDTHWLADSVGESGHVFAFDLQLQAIELSKKRLQQSKLSQRVSFSQTSHAEISKVIDESHREKISAVVFNLGFLPGGDPSVITTAGLTIKAIAQCLEFLKPNGLLSVVCYPYHDGGGDETQQVLAWFEKLESSQFRLEIVHHPQGNTKSPFPVFVTKLNDEKT